MFERLNNNEIENYLEFLCRPWSEILYHPHFDDYKKALTILIQKMNLNPKDLEGKEINDWP